MAITPSCLLNSLIVFQGELTLPIVWEKSRVSQVMKNGSRIEDNEPKRVY